LNLLSDIITYVRRIIKSPSNAVISDNLIIDYINRFWMMDVDARVQLFDLKTTYQFQTQPGVDKYNMPLYNVQIEPGNQNIGLFPVYQGFLGPAYINGIQVSFHTQKGDFYGLFPNVVQNLGVVATGSNSAGPYTIQIPLLPGNQPQNPPFNGILRGHIDINGIVATGNNVDPPVAPQGNISGGIASVPVTSVQSAFYLTSLDADGNNVVVADSGWFVDTNVNLGYLMEPGKAPFGNQFLPIGGPPAVNSNTINYLTGEVNVTFPVSIPQDQNISAQVFFFQSGLPRSILYYNNTLTLRNPPDSQYLVQLEAYLAPAAFLNTNAAIPFGYMAEYIARGAARKILSDTGDIEQFQFYEPLFREQELLVWKRSQRQWTATRTETIYSKGIGSGIGVYTNIGGPFNT